MMNKSLIYIVMEQEDGEGPWRPVEWRTKIGDANVCMDELLKEYPADRYKLTQLPGY